jgi:ribonuclease HII
VVCAAVVLRDESPLLRVNDSKQIEEDEREELFAEIVANALAVRISFGQPAAIDLHNILQATLMSMHRAVDALRPRPDLVLVDGRELFQWDGRMIPVIKGDGKSLRVAAASVVAKVARDRLMRRLHLRYPRLRLRPQQGLWHVRPLGCHPCPRRGRRAQEVLRPEIRCKQPFDVLIIIAVG